LSTGFFNSAESVVTYAATVAELILLVRLAWLGLIREFRIFWIFLAFDSVRTLALIGRDYHSHTYESMWVITAPVWTLLLAGAAFELLRGLAQPMPRDRLNGTVALYGFLIGMTVSAVASMLAHPYVILRSASLFLMISRRCVLSGCVLAILAQAAFLAFGGAPLIANWRRHRSVLLVFMMVLVIGSFVGTFPNSQPIEWINLLRSVSLLACYCAWIPMFERAWSHLRFPRISPSGWPEEFLSEETLAEIFAYRAREARLAAAEPATRRA
jgi:hypothetical protein